jgi:hypothetical protein
MRPKAVNYVDEKFAKCWKTTHQPPPTCGLNRVSRLSPKSNSGGIHIVEAQAKARVPGPYFPRQNNNMIGPDQVVNWVISLQHRHCLDFATINAWPIVTPRALHRTVATPCSYLT